MITTSPKVKIKGATHIEFDEHHAYAIAKQILTAAIDNYKNRGEMQIPAMTRRPGARASRTNISTTCWAGLTAASFRPLNDAIMTGRIRGVAAIVGCNNPRSKQDYLHIPM